MIRNLFFNFISSSYLIGALLLKIPTNFEVKHNFLLNIQANISKYFYGFHLILFGLGFFNDAIFQLLKINKKIKIIMKPYY